MRFIRGKQMPLNNHKGKNNKLGVMEVACACDDSYLPHAATMLCSLLENTPGPIRIHFLHGQINWMKILQLARFIRNMGAGFEDHPITDDAIHKLVTVGHFSSATYYRLLLPDILPITLNKVLYLDCDLIIRKPIDTLWNYDLGNSLFGAVEDMVPDEHKIQLGMLPDAPYFNSGVMLFNLKEWRKRAFNKNVIELIFNHPNQFPFVDQDGLNISAGGDWTSLPKTWNVLHQYFFVPGYRARYADVIADPAIVHFTGEGQGLKPWQIGKYRHPYSLEYHKYRYLTPWNRYKHEDSVKKTIKQVIKKDVKKVLRRLSTNKLIYRINNYIYRTADFIRLSGWHKTKKLFRHPYSMTIDEIKMLFPGETVLAGPFVDMRYINTENIGSTISPKLLGTYEIELGDIIEEICSGHYSTIVDIGCAEGYYAVGFALRIPGLKMYAYDIDPKARGLCREMAETNGVADRVEISDFFTMRSLQTITPKENGLIFCDCEGAEEDIFYNDGANFNKLIKNFDLLIEIHDFNRPRVSGYIHDLFSTSHDVQVVYSVPDSMRPIVFGCPVFTDEKRDLQVKLMAELRTGIMQWFYLKRKNLPI
jgi:lipopolysaccharide biosynthesis glycosyltransferase